MRTTGCTGPGTVDMKGGVVLALGVARALAERPELFAELALLLVTDEEWRTTRSSHVERFSGYDACLCFEAGERGPRGRGGRGRPAQGGRHAAGRPRPGRPAHSGSAPDQGANALLALARAAAALAGRHEPAARIA